MEVKQNFYTTLYSHRKHWKYLTYLYVFLTWGHLRLIVWLQKLFITERGKIFCSSAFYVFVVLSYFVYIELIQFKMLLLGIFFIWYPKIATKSLSCFGKIKNQDSNFHFLCATQTNLHSQYWIYFSTYAFFNLTIYSFLFFGGEQFNHVKSLTLQQLSLIFIIFILFNIFSKMKKEVSCKNWTVSSLLRCI